MSEQISTPVTRASPSIPDYELLRPVGRGAYGEVWLARNLTGSFVALKIVHRAAFDHDRPFEREFEGIQRFEPISRSDPSQVAVLHVGRGDGFFYYVMELADDGAESNQLSVISNQSPAPRAKSLITDHCLLITSYTPKTLKRLLNDLGARPANECLAIALSLTRALAHLHEHGLVHRDVKPSNVIFVGGVAKLADIGLVTSVDATRSFVGTEGYLPPEGAGTPRADLYSLGKVLYEMSTGCDRKEFPALPPDIATRLDRDALAELNAIVVRACQLDLRERYASAQTLHDDLALLQRGKSIKRVHAWRRNLNHAKKFALAISALVVVSAIVYSLTVGRTRTPDFVWSTNDEANVEYKAGVRYLAATEGLKAIEHFERAIAKDTNFAEAYAHMASAWMSVSGATNMPKARVAAEKAVSLNPNSAAAHAFLASVKLSYLDWAGADRERRLSLRLNPNSEEILLESALHLADTGRTNQALATLERALRINPDSGSNLRVVYSGFVYAWCRQYDRAIEIYNQAPWGGHWMQEQQAQAYLAKGDYTNSIRIGKMAALGRAEDPKQVNTEFEALEKGFKEGGPRKYWELKLEFETPKTGEDHLMRMAAIHARLNHPDKAFENLRRAMRETPVNFLVAIYNNPSFDNLRTDERFGAMISELWRKK